MIRRGVGKETITEDGFEVFAFLSVKRCLKCGEDVAPGHEGEHMNCNVDNLTLELLNIINERKGGENQ